MSWFVKGRTQGSLTNENLFLGSRSCSLWHLKEPLHRGIALSTIYGSCFWEVTLPYQILLNLLNVHRSLLSLYFNPSLIPALLAFIYIPLCILIEGTSFFLRCMFLAYGNYLLHDKLTRILLYASLLLIYLQHL